MRYLHLLHRTSCARLNLLCGITDAPAAVGPYTQAVKLGDLLFLSGSLGLDPAAGKLVSFRSRLEQT